MPSHHTEVPRDHTEVPRDRRCLPDKVLRVSDCDRTLRRLSFPELFCARSHFSELRLEADRASEQRNPILFALRTLECEPINYEQREREPERLFAQSSSDKHAGMGA
jgi:hypothetical protein